MTKVRVCSVCGQRLDEGERRCPYCGGRPRGSHGWAWAILFCVLAGIGSGAAWWWAERNAKGNGQVTVTDEFAAAARRYTALQPFSEGLAAVRGQNGKWGYMDLRGREVIAPAYDHAAPFTAGVAQVKSGRHINYIDTAGMQVPGMRRRALPRVDRGYRVFTVDGAVPMMGIADSTGAIVVDALYDSLTYVSQGLAVAVVRYDSLPGTPDLEAALADPLPTLDDNDLDRPVYYATDSAITARMVRRELYGYVDMTGRSTFAAGTVDRAARQRQLMHRWRMRNDTLRRLDDERLRRIEARRQQTLRDSLDAVLDAYL